MRRRLLHCFIVVCIGYSVDARSQDTLLVALPDVYITADRVLQGDGDTYGLGDWKCVFTIALEDSLLLLKGKVVFAENANDYTRIVGRYEGYWGIGVLKKYKSCRVRLGETSGSVSGQNFGARGYRRFKGQGLIRSARVRCDVLGTDTGQIGAAVHFAPLLLKLDCALAENAPPRAQNKRNCGDLKCSCSSRLKAGIFRSFKNFSLATLNCR